MHVVCGRFLAWADAADAEFEARPWKVTAVPFGPLASRVRWLRQGLTQRTCRLLEHAAVAAADRGLDPVVGDLSRAARAVGADLYIGHNLSGLVAAAAAARHHAARLGFDFEDDHVGELPDLPQHAAERARRDAAVRRGLAGCRLLTASSPGIARRVASRYGVHPTVILNVFPRDQAPGRAVDAPVSDTLYWVSQTIGPGRGLEPMLEAMGAMRAQPVLVLRGRAMPAFIDALRSRAADLGLAPSRIEVLPPIAPSAITASCAGHALGLSAELVTCDNRADCLGNKIFHYLLAGTPVVLSDTPAQRALAAELGAAALLVDLGSAQRLADVLDAWFVDETARRTAREKASRLALERYNWDLESVRYLDAVQAAVR